MLLAHRQRGAGPPLVLVHGVGSFAAAWEPVLDALAAEREVIAVDLPGFGDSAPLTDRSVTVANLAAAVAEFAAGEYGHERFHVAGNSLGGGVALELAKSGHALTATAISPIWFWSRAEVAYARAVLKIGRRLATELRPYGERAVGSAVARTLFMGAFFGRPWRIAPPDAAAAFANLAGSPGWERTLEATLGSQLEQPERITVPITVLWGAFDLLLPPWQRNRAATRLPGAEVRVLKGCGHVPMFDDPALVAREILAGSAR